MTAKVFLAQDNILSFYETKCSGIIKETIAGKGIHGSEMKWKTTEHCAET